MGAVRVQVRLTNAVDEALVRRGSLTSAEVRTYVADALVDTGAVRMVLPPQVVVASGSVFEGSEWRSTLTGAPSQSTSLNR